MDRKLDVSSVASEYESSSSESAQGKDSLGESLNKAVTFLGFTKGKAQTTKVGYLLGKRKCRGICSVLLFFALIVLLVVINVTQDFEASYLKSTSFATSTDKQRRICAASNQIDTRAPDYSGILMSTDSMLNFCLLMTEVFGGKPEFASFDCNKEFVHYTFNETSRFLSLLTEEYSDMSQYSIGYNYGSIICVSEQYLNERDFATDKCSSSKPNAAFVADREALDIIPFLVQKTKSYAEELPCNNVGSKECQQQEVAELLWEQLQELDVSSEFFTQGEMELIKDMISQLFSEHNYVLDFFHQTQSDDLADYIIYYDPKSFGSGIIPTECVTNYERAVKSESISINYVVTIVQYYYTALEKPVPTAIQEFDMQLRNAGLSVVISFALTIVFQLFMYGACQVSMCTALFGVDAFLVYLSSECIIYAKEMIITSDQYYQEFKVYNLSYEMQATLFIVLSIIIIVISVLVSFAALLLLSLINVLGKLIKIARKSLRRAWQIMFVPLIVLAFSCAWIFMHIILIFLNIAKFGEFDAKYNTFVATGSATTQFYYYGLLVFLIISMLFGIFLSLSILQFLAGSIVTEYYFLYKDEPKKILFRRSLRHMFEEFGDILKHAFFSTFLVWFRFVFEFISNKNVELPEESLPRKIVEFSRSYVSLCSKYTLFEMSCTGKSYKEAREDYIELMGQSINKISSIKSIISVFFLFSKILIPIVSWIVFEIIRTYASAKYETVILLWINIFSMLYGYLNASMALDLTEYILDVICHCYVMELAENGGAVYSVPDDFAVFVQTYVE